MGGTWELHSRTARQEGAPAWEGGEGVTAVSPAPPTGCGAPHAGSSLASAQCCCVCRLRRRQPTGQSFQEPDLGAWRSPPLGLGRREGLAWRGLSFLLNVCWEGLDFRLQRAALTAWGARPAPPCSQPAPSPLPSQLFPRDGLHNCVFMTG